MQFPDVSGKRLMVILAATTVIGLLVGASTLGPYFQLGYGLPSPNGKLVRYTQTINNALIDLPVFGTVFSWTYFDTQFHERQECINIFGVVLRGVYLRLRATLSVKIEVTALAGPTEITNQTVIFKVAEDPTRNVTIFRRNEYHVFSYSFKVNYAWSGAIAISETAPSIDSFALNCPSVDQMKETVIKTLISKYNAIAYEKTTTLSWDLNAPSLATLALPSPGYAGLMGLFLQTNLRLGGYANSGTAADISPQQEGTVVAICLDQYITTCPREAWNLGFPTPIDWTAPSDFVYYPDHFATPYAYWTTNVNTFGSTISFEKANRNYPDWWSWAYQASGISIGLNENCQLPCAAQWFRADVLELTSTPFEVPNYNIPPELEGQAINVPLEPVNLGTSNPPEQPLSEQLRLFWQQIWNTAKWAVIAVIVVLVLLVAFVVVRKIP